MKLSSTRRDMAEGIFHAMNNRDFEAFENTTTEDVSFDFPGIPQTNSKRKTILILRSILRKYPKLQFRISETLVENNRACVVWTNEGEDTNGNPYTNSGITLIHFTDEKIAFISDYFKDTSFTNP